MAFQAPDRCDDEVETFPHIKPTRRQTTMAHSQVCLLVMAVAAGAASFFGCSASNGNGGGGGGTLPGQADSGNVGAGGLAGSTAAGVSGGGGMSGSGGMGSGGSGGLSTTTASTGTGGSGTGGWSATGGSSGSGGVANGGSGTGGSSARGGSTGSGGSAAGGTGTGGRLATGGSSGAGGSGGSSGTGGTAATGGATSAGGTTGSPISSYKPRVIHTTDLGADPDDEESLVRVMVTANEFDLEGLIVVTSLWKTSQSSTSMLDKILNAYGQALPNLQKHASNFPSLAYLQSITKLGQKNFGMADVGDGKDTDGSNLIIAAVDKGDPRPVWVNLWGGGNTLAQALQKVKSTRTQTQVDQFVSKLRVYDVLGQDDAGAWMTKTFPNLFYIRFLSVYSWQPSDSWVATNVQSHGPLGAVYPTKKYALEGDTPSFLYEYPNGLTDPDHVDWGSWGGRCDPAKKAGVRGMTGGASYNEAQYDPYSMYSDAAEGGSSISRWRTAIDNDFQARMEWSTASTYSGANHHPIAVVNGDTTRAVLQLSASAGSEVTMSADGSSDPDQNSLTYAWSFFKEPSSYTGTVTISGASSASAKVAVPSGAGGRTIHVILELHDNGTPNLYAYRRVVINVK
jgi:hypothetical protein